MATLLSLPSELLCSIGEHLSFDDVRYMSVAHTKLRRILAPHIFRCLRFTNDEENQQVIESIVTRNGRHVRQLALELNLHIAGDDGEEPVEAAETLTGLSQKLLSGSLLPDASRLSINS
jgi:hypothetical protein